MSDTEVDYLQPDFEPASVTMPRLRSILVSQNIPYPATAKKAQLVEIFNENVAPRARKLLSQRQKAKRSSMGITNIDGSQGYSVTNEELQAPPSASRSRSPRKPTRTVRQEPEDDIPEHATLSPRKQQSRSTGRQLAQSDTDTDSHYESRQSARKTPRRVELPPQPEVKLEEESEDDDAMSQRQSVEPGTVFSNDNPFQSRSPSIPFATPSSRRRTAANEPTPKRTTSSSSRRFQAPMSNDYEPTGFSKQPGTPSNPFARPKTPKTPKTPRSPEPEPVEVSESEAGESEASESEASRIEAGEIEAGEEFTPDQQLALTQEDALRAQTAVVPIRQNKRSTSLATPIWVLFVTLFGAYAAWYRQEKLAVGYCGVGRSDQHIIPRQLEYNDFKLVVPDWALQLAEPECEPCPSHAYCYADGSVRCEDDFILKPHPLSAGGLVPLPPTCEPDGEKARRVKAVADKAIEELRERQAKFECGELTDEHGHPSPTAMITVEELKETVSEKRSKKLNKKEFDDLWAAALGEIETRDEVVVEHETQTKPVDI